ncbi:MAG: lipid 4-phosphatase [Alphaproteobacteria bacterium]|jgi:membrane-associated PAP2 superfamily phosphatase|nr:lipid 4-phosphatase [Alphaproteobacteria bacterium]
MNRTGLLIALAVAIPVGLLFGLHPKLDLDLAEPFYLPDVGLWTVHGLWARKLRIVASWLIALIAAPAFIGLALKLLLPARPLMLPGRAAILMIATLALAPGLVANVILKDTWGRPRPIDVTEFRGRQHFVPWWDPRGECPKNCSFIGGEAAGAFWTLAPASLAPPQWRALAYGAALAFGSGLSYIRIAGGGHFFTDCVFAGVFTFLTIWLVHGLLYRWRPTRITDAAVERALEAIAMPGYRVLVSVAARLRAHLRGRSANG